MVLLLMRIVLSVWSHPMAFDRDARILIAFWRKRSARAPARVCHTRAGKKLLRQCGRRVVLSSLKKERSAPIEPLGREA